MSSTESAWETVIGLEVHAQLATRSKIFSSAPVAFGQPPNSLVNDVCAGLPGALPVLNREAVALALRAGLALGCSIQRVSVFARKNYFYPDLPKGYQISQFEQPICLGGAIPYELDGEQHSLRLTRIHMEEDAGKSTHTAAGPYSAIDLNRAGTPLVEIVSEPELHSAEHAAACFRELRSILVALGVNDGNMAEGSMRCDANVSVRRRGDTTLGTKVEIKNLNSFKFLRDAIRAESQRQIDVLERGGALVQETRLWHEVERRTVPMRTKEGSADYRYFPDPDLPPLIIEEGWIATVRANLPELPGAQRARLQQQHGLSAYDATVLVALEGAVPVFDGAVAAGAPPKGVANLLSGIVAASINEGRLRWDAAASAFVPVAAGPAPSSGRVDGPRLGELAGLLHDGVISSNAARDVLDRMLASDASPRRIVDEAGLQQLSDTDALDAIIREVIASMPDAATSYRSGNRKVLALFIGRVMKSSSGRANPGLVQERLRALLAETE
mgnify:FL=1